MRLFHVSDRAGIERFDPQPAPRAGVDGAMVWAVDAEHLANYLLPRECPRVTFAAGPDSDPAGAARLIGPVGAGRVVAVESGWIDEIRHQRLVRYEFDPAGFELQDAAAGYYVSREPAEPIAETPIDDILAALLAEDVELRIVPTLWPLREAVIASTLEFSIIRMRNAAAPPDGLAGTYPLP